MVDANEPSPISHLLRRAISEAVKAGRTTYLGLEHETGVTWSSIMRFVRGSQFLRLDMADRLAAFFGLALRAKGKGR